MKNKIKEVIPSIVSMILMGINGLNGNIALTIVFGVLSIICVMLVLKDEELKEAK
jgi:hypothetical protein